MMQLKEAIEKMISLSSTHDYCLYVKPNPNTGRFQEDSEAHFDKVEGSIFFADTAYIEEYLEIQHVSKDQSESVEDLIAEINDSQFGRCTTR